MDDDYWDDVNTEYVQAQARREGRYGSWWALMQEADGVDMGDEGVDAIDDYADEDD